MVVLKKVRTEDEADRFVQEMGWSDNRAFSMDVGDSLVGYWIDTDEDSEPPEKAKIGFIEPICVIVHGRLFPEKAFGYKLGSKAWITEEHWEDLF